MPAGGVSVASGPGRQGWAEWFVVMSLCVCSSSPSPQVDLGLLCGTFRSSRCPGLPGLRSSGLRQLYRPDLHQLRAPVQPCYFFCERPCEAPWLNAISLYSPIEGTLRCGRRHGEEHVASLAWSRYTRPGSATLTFDLI